MFRTVSITAFLITIGSIALHLMIFRPRLDQMFGKDRKYRILDILRIPVFLLTLFFFEQKLNLAGIFRKIVYLVAILCFAVLAITGFSQRLVFAEAISSYWLMLHATAAPVFAACLAILAVMWAHNCRFDKNYFPWIQTILRRQPTNTERGEKYEFVRKTCFWLIMILALPLILSIVSSMFPIFGTHGQELLIEFHRYFALAFAIAVILHTYFVILSQVKR